LGFFDLQVNGYAGVDFNSEISGPESVAAMEAVCLRLEQQNVEGILATVITDTVPVMTARLQRLAELRRQSPAMQRIVRGIHVEGPFINPAPGYRGAHPVDAITPTDTTAMQQFLDAADGMIKLVTLAPEGDPGMRVTRMLADQGVVVSAGHTDASLDDLKRAIDAGLTMFTHLGNGCPATMARHDNIIQRALSLRDKLWLCFIADGAHIPYFVLRNYLDLTGLDRTIVVTDCIVAADLGPGRFTFGRWDLNIGEDLVARAPDNSHLVGSTVTMPQSLINLTTHLGLSATDAHTLLEHNPKRAMGL
jgi:N-acetylglucosamine-6-phosphate deacetylase